MRGRGGKPGTRKRKRQRRMKFRERLKTLARRRPTHVTPSALWAACPCVGAEGGRGLVGRKWRNRAAPGAGCSFVLSVPAMRGELWGCLFGSGCCQTLLEVPTGVIVVPS